MVLLHVRSMTAPDERPLAHLQQLQQYNAVRRPRYESTAPSTVSVSSVTPTQQADKHSVRQGIRLQSLVRRWLQFCMMHHAEQHNHAVTSVDLPRQTELTPPPSSCPLAGPCRTQQGLAQPQ